MYTSDDMCQCPLLEIMLRILAGIPILVNSRHLRKLLTIPSIQITKSHFAPRDSHMKWCDGETYTCTDQ